MKETELPQRQPPAPTAPPKRSGSRRRIWLAAAIVTLLLGAGALLLPRFLDLALVKEQLQATVAKRTGGRLDYQGLDFSLLPWPSIELQGVSLVIPELAEATAAGLRVVPDLFPLLKGDVHLARLELDTPQLTLHLPEKRAALEWPGSLIELQEWLLSAMAPFGKVIAGLQIEVHSGRFIAAENGRQLAAIDGMDLQAGTTITGLDSARIGLQAKLSELRLVVNGNTGTIKDLELNGAVQLGRDGLAVQLDRLVVADPALALTGDLTLSPAAPALSLNLTGRDIDVDATRSLALSLAGDITPIKEIFDYLRGGRVPVLSFTSQGESPAELGDLNHILIRGQLQGGKVSVPEIRLDLAGVEGEVVVDRGVLQGNGLAARLAKSTGRDGTLRLDLTKENKLFQLDLLLNADLAETLSVLHYAVPAPAFQAELAKITSLQGTTQGRLTLGDRLDDINVKVEAADLQLSAEHKRLPGPLTVTGGQLAFTMDRLDLNRLNGSLGQSRFAELSGSLLRDKQLAINVASGQFDLDMTELYPWLAAMKGVGPRLDAVSGVTGRLALSALKLEGSIDDPAAWRFATSGTVKDLALGTKFFPDGVSLAGGEFTVDQRQLSFNKLQTAGQDAKLIVSGGLKGFPRQLDRLDLSLDGRLGPRSVKWLAKTFKVPDFYLIRAPLEISRGQLSWQPEGKVGFKGVVTIEKGPAVTADADYQAGHLQVRKLHIKDRSSDADMAFALDPNRWDFRFTGSLRHDTLQALFVDNHFASGRLEGDFTVTIPQTGETSATTAGRLTGERLPILLTSGDLVNIDRISLTADGPRVKADISRLLWKDRTWEPIEGTISFSRNRADVRLTRTRLCGIAALGLFSYAGDEFALDMTLAGKDLDVTTSYTCLTAGQVKATGSLDFSSKLTSHGRIDQLVRGLRGPLEMTFSRGVIKQSKFVSRTLEVLNVTEIVKGRLPNLDSKGLPYSTITLQGEFRGGELLIERFHMDGETLGLVGTGKIRLEEETIDAQLLAAPFRTVDSIVKHIPGVNYLLGGTLVTIPMRVSGPLDDPRVTILSPSAVGASLYNLAERTITSPFKLLEMLNPWGKDK